MIRVTVKLIPHPDPQRAIDVLARLVLNEILQQEKETKQQEGDPGGDPGNYG